MLIKSIAEQGLSVKAGMGESGNGMRGMKGSQGGNAGNHGTTVWNQVGDARNQDRNAGESGWECG